MIFLALVLVSNLNYIEDMKWLLPNTEGQKKNTYWCRCSACCSFPIYWRRPHFKVCPCWQHVPVPYLLPFNNTIVAMFYSFVTEVVPNNDIAKPLADFHWAANHSKFPRRYIWMNCSGISQSGETNPKPHVYCKKAPRNWLDSQR
jgi:hypothetical protein